VQSFEQRPGLLGGFPDPRRAKGSSTSCPMFCCCRLPMSTRAEPTSTNATIRPTEFANATIDCGDVCINRRGQLAETA
jgi:hypothetical protein